MIDACLAALVAAATVIVTIDACSTALAIVMIDACSTALVAAATVCDGDCDVRCLLVAAAYGCMLYVNCGRSACVRT